MSESSLHLSLSLYVLLRRVEMPPPPRSTGPSNAGQTASCCGFWRGGAAEVPQFAPAPRLLPSFSMSMAPAGAGVSRTSTVVAGNNSGSEFHSPCPAKSTSCVRHHHRSRSVLML